MAGFLDKNTRIIDLVLTGYGRNLFSKGKLNFCYWTPFDDEIDYEPFISSSGSMTDSELSSSIYLSIESTPVREATTGYRMFNLSGSDNTNVNHPLYTMSQKQQILPRAKFPSLSEEQSSVLTYQRRVKTLYYELDSSGKEIPKTTVDVGIERFDSSEINLDFSYENDSFQPDFQSDGFLISVFRSGSSGLLEVEAKRDMNNDLAYMNDLQIHTGKKGG